VEAGAIVRHLAAPEASNRTRSAVTGSGSLGLRTECYRTRVSLAGPTAIHVGLAGNHHVLQIAASCHLTGECLAVLMGCVFQPHYFGPGLSRVSFQGQPQPQSNTALKADVATKHGELQNAVIVQPGVT
jgi:hypothetical protein